MDGGPTHATAPLQLVRTHHRPRAIGTPSASCSSNQQLFLNTTSDVALLPLVVDGGHGDLTPSRPTSEMRATSLAEGITALFDGAELERI